MPLIYQKFITRQDLQANPNSLYIFGDNAQRRGLRGQAAEMRGEPNAVGIPTKWYPSMKEDAFFKDSQIELIKTFLVPIYMALIDELRKGVTVVWPEDNIGTGLSRLPQRAPILWEHMERSRKYLETLNNWKAVQ